MNVIAERIEVEGQAEKASNSYLMSIVAIIVGLPLPIVNLLATFIFFMANRKGAYYVRWHCTQALLSQFVLFMINSFGFWWTVNIILGHKEVDNTYIAYLFTVILVNIIEFIVTIYAAIETRKGRHIRWWFYGGLTDALVKPSDRS